MYISKTCKFNICQEAVRFKLLIGLNLLIIRNFTLNNDGSYSGKERKSLLINV